MRDEGRNAFERFMNKMIGVVDGPVTWFRETVVVPNQQHYPYYHRHYPRVPTIDECYENDAPCMYEANLQFKRDMRVDGAIVNILRQRKLECVRYEGHERHERCKKIFDEYAEAELNYFIQYGDLGAFPTAKWAYMKQKHRMVHERRKAAGTWNPEK